MSTFDDSFPLPERYLGAIRPDDGTAVQLVSLPLPSPGPHEVLIRNVAAAANPKDFKVPCRERNWGYVPGSDVAGVVVQLGEGAEEEGVRVGMRVAALAKIGRQESKDGAYAEYTVAPACTTIELPEAVGFEAGATIALAVFTAYVALFVDLAVAPPPSFVEPYVDASRAKEAVLVYGASSSVGAYAVQLAKRAGYTVIGVAGSSSDYASSLGADVIIDYRAKSASDLTNELIGALQSRALTSGAALDCIAEGDSSLVLATVLAEVPARGKRLMVSRLAPAIPGQFERFPGGVALARTYVATSAHEKDSDLCRDFARQLTQALVASPANVQPFRPNRVKIMPDGLLSIAQGIELLKRGEVHAEKLVYRISETPRQA